MKSVLARLERLEQMAQTDDVVSILELLPSGEWELIMGEKRSTHRTMEESQRAYKEHLQKCRKTEKDSVLIICDI